MMLHEADAAAPVAPLPDRLTGRRLLVGCGHMGGALLGRWQDRDPGSFLVVEPRGDAPTGDVPRVASPAELAEERFDLIVLGLKPDLCLSELPRYRAHLAPDGCVVSIAAGVTLAAFEAAAPGLPVVRAMPNLPARIGLGVTALVAGSGTTLTQRERVDDLFRNVGQTLWLGEERHIDAVTAMAGSGPGYVFELARLLADASVALGIPQDQAREVVLRTIAGAALLALEDPRELSALRDAVTSPGGTTEAGLAALTADGQLAALVGETLRAARDRARQLARAA